MMRPLARCLCPWKPLTAFAVRRGADWRGTSWAAFSAVLINFAPASGHSTACLIERIPL